MPVTASIGQLGRHPADRLGVEAVADAEVGVDVAPAGRALLQLLAQLADEDVDRAVAVGHRVAPDPLVDRLALEHLALGVGEQLQQLELAPGQVEAAAADEGLELVGADLQLAGDQRPGLGARRGRGGGGGRRLRSAPSPPRGGRAWRSSRRPRAAGRAPAGRRSSGRCRRRRRGRGASRRPAPGSSQASSPSTARSSSSAFSFIATSSSGGIALLEHALLPAGGLGALGEHGDETAVVVDYRKPDGLLWIQVGGAGLWRRSDLLGRRGHCMQQERRVTG